MQLKNQKRYPRLPHLGVIFAHLSRHFTPVNNKDPPSAAQLPALMRLSNRKRLSRRSTSGWYLCAPSIIVTFYIYWLTINFGHFTRMLVRTDSEHQNNSSQWPPDATEPRKRPSSSSTNGCYPCPIIHWIVAVGPRCDGIIARDPHSFHIWLLSLPYLNTSLVSLRHTFHRVCAVAPRCDKVIASDPLCVHIWVLFVHT
jgi:hypothetical protein